MNESIYEKIKDKLTIEYLANMLVFETYVEDGYYDYEENYEERWESCYSINIPEEFRDNDVDDFGYGWFSSREEAVAEAIEFLKHVGEKGFIE